MTIAYYLIIVLHLLACFFLIGVVLLQQGKSQDLASAFGGGGTQAAFGPRGSANVLTKATAILAGVFVVTCLALSMLRPKSSSVLDKVPAAPPAASPAAAVPPAAPVTTVPAPAGASPAAK
ncbi:MAG TPA: preprotein translocase subunit SecG [Vicinamibacteria bacterium]|nr:preprotein translocase subunit SecG [Vicinamibacteria bacterium]